MTLLRRLLPLAVICLFALSACKPSTTPSAPGASSSPASKAASVRTMPSNAPQLAPSGQYAVLPLQQATEGGSKVEVIEFFAYFCSHCKSFDPLLSNWAKKNESKVVFKRVPVAFRDDATAQQSMYFALEAMGKLDSLHEKLFDAVQVQRVPLNKEAEILDFLAKSGVDKSKFKALYDSFGVKSQVQQAVNLQTAYQINSVPNVAVGGRYITSVSHAQKRPGVKETEAGLQAATLEILDELVAKSLQEKKNGKH